LQRYFKHRERE